jgi:hypothetical protein
LSLTLLCAPTGQFVHKHEIDNMWLYRQVKASNGTAVTKKRFEKYQ